MATITCPYCKVRSHMTPLYGSVASEPLGDQHLSSVSHRCDECGRVSIATRATIEPRSSSSDYVRAAFAEAASHITWEPKTVLGREFPDIPDHIAEPASEAFACFSIGAYRGAVLLARSVIEASAKEKGITKGTLFQKIDELAEKEHIRKKLAKAAHEVRMAGNDMAHGDFATAEITEVDADELLGLMEDFLTEMFELDTRVQRRKDRRTASS